MVNTLVAFGDSFTHGDELPDDDLAKSNPDLATALLNARLESPYFKKETFDLRNKEIRRLNNNVIDYRKMCNQLSYIGQLSDMLMMPYENHAIQGQSIQAMFMHLLEYIEYYGTNGKIFIIATGMSARQTIYLEETDYFKGINWRFLVDVFGTGKDEDTDYILENVLEEKSQALLFQSYVSQINKLLERKKAKYILISAKDELDRITITHKISRCAFGHPSTDAHKIFAQELEPKIKALL